MLGLLASVVKRQSWHFLVGDPMDRLGIDNDEATYSAKVCYVLQPRWAFLSILELVLAGLR